ncbi:RidA family protein [Hoeflea prorocentri]|uniref:RidA family protein n=1 Tax=Hoeflea prorocentri TaxID=1922333 RepID=A0A9X3UFJ7_9HYPH|nr:RidA family protein [Hoeflea prorocentri]MCY6379689.1 RidA family protein [Hoeflea prorocentri]MDA5397489.1 RidA family protein [Hoeflea prorocentri]
MSDPIVRSGRNPGSRSNDLDRSSEIISHNGVAYFVATPEKPYDPNLDAAQMMRQALEKVEFRLAKLGSDKSDLLLVQIWLRDMRFFAEINEVWDSWVDQNNLPVRCCCACDMGNPDLKVELVVTARARNANALEQA